MELWGSPGGMPSNNGYNNHPGGKGGYTKIYIEIQATKLYVIVGGSGSPISGDISAGGYNGGGYTYTCPYGPHSASGGGMTHVSYTDNVAVTNPSAFVAGTWNPNGTIAVAGGGGGGYISGRDVGTPGSNWTGGHGGGNHAGSGIGFRGIAYGATTTKGYARGCGQSSNVGSSGGGGGWYGGRAIYGPRTGECICASPGGGGSGYICDAGKQTIYTNLNVCINGNSVGVPAKPNAGTALGQHGYVRVQLIERIKN